MIQYTWPRETKIIKQMNKKQGEQVKSLGKNMSIYGFNHKRKRYIIKSDKEISQV